MTRRDATTPHDAPAAATNDAGSDTAGDAGGDIHGGGTDEGAAKEAKDTKEPKKASSGSEVDVQLAALEALAEQLKVQVSYEPMTGVVSGAGGLCRLKGSYRVIIDRRLKPRERAQILSDALRRFDLDRVELSPDVRPWVGAAASPVAEA